jgi:hypothetical protein
MIESAPYHRQITLAHGQKPILNMVIGRTGAKVTHLEVVVPVHAHALARVTGKKCDIDRAGHVERPAVNSFRVDLRFNDTEVVQAMTGKVRVRAAA